MTNDSYSNTVLLCDVIRAVSAMREQSALAWAGAIEGAEREGRAGRAGALRIADADCDNAYDAALWCLDSGRGLRGFAAAVRSLQDAQWLERDAGDDSHAQAALEAVQALCAQRLAEDVQAIVGSDGSADIRVIAEQALLDDPRVTAPRVAEIVREAREEFAAEQS
jgi:hypothetical protein